MQRGKIIFLNGTSSAGKTTLSKVLQDRLPDQYFLLPVDILQEIGPQKNSHTYDITVDTFSETIEERADRINCVDGRYEQAHIPQNAVAAT